MVLQPATSRAKAFLPHSKGHAGNRSWIGTGRAMAAPATGVGSEPDPRTVDFVVETWSALTHGSDAEADMAFELMCRYRAEQSQSQRQFVGCADSRAHPGSASGDASSMGQWCDV